MRTRQRKLAAMRQDVADGGRSSLFLFMVRHHTDLVDEGHDGRMPWVKLCKRFADDGLVDGHGQKPTPKRAGKTWREACEEVQRLSSAQTVTLQPHRSGRPGSWKPPTVPAMELSRPAVDPTQSLRPVDRPPSLTGTSPVSRPALDQDPSVEDQFAEVRRQFAANDRKRFGSM